MIMTTTFIIYPYTSDLYRARFHMLAKIIKIIKLQLL